MTSSLLAGRRTSLGLAIFCCLLWGSAFPMVKLGLGYFTPTFFAGLRFTVAGGALLLLARLTGLRFPPARAWRPILLVGLVQTVVGYFLFFQGMRTGNAVTASIVVSTGPLMVAVMAYPLLGEGNWSLPRVSGILVGFAGTLLAVLRPGWQPDFTPGGEGLILLSTLALSYASILAKRIAGEWDALFIAGGSMFSGGLLLLLLARATEPLALQHLSPASALILVYTAFISAAAFSIWYALFKYNDVSTISTVKFTIPIFGSLLSALVLGEPLTVFKAAGGLLVALGTWLIFRRRGRPAAVAPGP